MEPAAADVILAELGEIKRLLREIKTGRPEVDWVDAREFCRLVGLRDTKALSYQMSKGVISGDALRNVGTSKRPRYRFHRSRAVDQFMNRSAPGAR